MEVCQCALASSIRNEELGIRNGGGGGRREGSLSSF